MSAEDAVFTAAVARDEVRKSLARMEYHLGRGRAGLRGVIRERNFLDALGRQASKLGGGAAGGTAIGGKAGLGSRALQAMQAQQGGNGVTSGRLKSSILADFSSDTMNGAREWTYDSDQQWVWVANASACPACLDNHGKSFSGPFTPMHPSCLCFPKTADDAARDGVRQLQPAQLIDTLEGSNNPAFSSVGNAIKQGRLTPGQAASQATRRTGKGLLRWKATLDEQAERAETQQT